MSWISEDDLIYMAGCIDCDGWITMGTGDFPQIGFGNTVKSLVEEFASLWESEVYERRTPRGKPNYQTMLWGKRAVDMLHQLIPYLRVKKPQALIVAMCPLSGWGGPSTLTEDDWTKRKSITEEIRILNAR